MKKKYLLLALLTLILVLICTGCGNKGQDIDGMYVATFEINGGRLDTGTSVVNDRIHFAYDPGTVILSPTDAENGLGYKITRSGYDFTGWYTSPDCLEHEKWSFTDRIDTESLVLYAGWQRQIVYTYSVCYTDGDETVTLGVYNVKAGAAFDDYRRYAATRDGYTPNGFYSDAALTEPWDPAVTHPGGDSDTDVRIYVDYIEGDWIIVDDLASLKSAIGAGNIYLTASIDCGGAELKLGELKYVFEGNGYSISNFVVNGKMNALLPSIALFDSLGEGARLENVSFEDVVFRFVGVSASARDIKVASVARSGSGFVIANVTVTGSILTDYAGELPRLNEPVYDSESTGTVTDFESRITVEHQD